jgi:hypothetical protein
MKRLQKRKLAWIIGTTLTASMAGAAWKLHAASSDSESFEGRYLQARAQEITLPETCKSPYREAPNFLEFFKTSIYVLAAQKGAGHAGVADLFAVESMREKMREIYPSSGEEGPMDRLIVAQLCLFEKVQTGRLARPGAPRIVVAPHDKDLQEHLLAIAPRLYQDARTLMIEALAQRAKERKLDLNIERQWDEVRKARRMGTEKIKDLLKDDL